MLRRIAILLCAGYGTRMGSLTAQTPKPLLPVAGKPILDYLLEQLLGFENLDAVHLVTNRRYVEPFRGWAERWRRGIEIHDDGSTANADRRGAVGDLALVLERVGLPDGAFVGAGDNILRFSLRPFWRAFVDGAENRVLAL
ncbi:MAG: NTP transferase domain-containing protein, partial [bacterium]|nr:NTP transferase domain-containing protein [bacterium]